MTEDSLREIVATVARLDSGQIGHATELNGRLGGSIGRARLDAAVRAKSGVSDPGVYRAATFGELCQVLGVESSAGAELTVFRQDTPILPAISSLENGYRVGVDIEPVAAMPAARDFWEDDFYKATFTPREIAYALLQASPRNSFAVMWCAKEAVRKADAALAGIGWQRIEVVHAADGRPGVAVDGQPTGSLSLSHTDELAVAVFVAGSLAPEAPLAPEPASPEPVILTAPKSSRVPALLSLLALLIAIAALALSWLRN